MALYAKSNFVTLPRKSPLKKRTQSPASITAKADEKNRLIELIAQIIAPLNPEDEIILIPPHLWTRRQYEQAICIDSRLALHLCREWQHHYIVKKNHGPVLPPPRMQTHLKDIFGILVSSSLSNFAKSVAKYAISHGADTTVLALKIGLNYLPACLGCKKPNLPKTSNFNMETKKILCENLTKRGRHAIEEAIALGLLTIAIKSNNALLTKVKLHKFAGTYLSPLFLERTSNKKAIWVNALHLYLENESMLSSREAQANPAQNRGICDRSMRLLNNSIEVKGIEYFIQKLAQNMRFFV